ncbi:MAG: ATP-binding cassette domain-containing protein [Firmicutes bacterium]|nr:ATP-binding cassette domain-containing protein [Bacillota bacterium]
MSTNNGEPIIKTESLTKRYAGGMLAVNEVSFEVRAGEIFGFLGPNGAGKTTTIMMLTTLVRPTSGRALVCGYDVAESPDRVRLQLGYVSQDVAVDETLSGRENLILQGNLYHLRPAELRERVDDVLTTVELTDHANSLVSTYSGGMRKRLDIAAGLLHRPRLLFLDEPTLGLDIQTRARIWEYVRRLRDEHGMTVFLTTHYMEEADHLCDRVAIIDHGQIVALDTPAVLKASLGGDAITICLARGQAERGAAGGAGGGDADPSKVIAAFPGVESVKPAGDGALQLVARDGDRAIPELLGHLASQGMRVESVTLKRPSLDDVFLRYTGRELRDNGGGADFLRTHISVRRMRS